MSPLCFHRKRLTIAIGIIALIGMEARLVAAPEDRPRFVLEIDREGKFTLEGKAVLLENLTKEAARLADQVRPPGKAKPADPESGSGLPALIIFRADEATPFSTIIRAASDFQSAGFRRLLFRLRSPEPDEGEGRTLTARKSNTDLPAAIRTVPILLDADSKGRISRIEIGDNEIPGIERLEEELVSILNDPELPFDQIHLRVAPGLRFSELVRVIQMLSGTRVDKVSFSLLEP